MNRTLAATATALPALAVAFGLSSCNQRMASAAPVAADGAGVSATSYCVPFKTTQASYPSATAADPSTAFEECAHRWGYTMAQARDTADIVAQAVRARHQPGHRPAHRPGRRARPLRPVASAVLRGAGPGRPLRRAAAVGAGVGGIAAA
jgi:hypothetical protein